MFQLWEDKTMSQHKSFNNIKPIKRDITFAATALATACVGAATTAHADPVPTNSHQTVPQATGQTSALKSAQDQSRQNYANANSANEAAQAELTSAQKASQSAQLDLVGAQQANERANAAVTNAQSVVNSDSNRVKVAQASVKTAQANYDEAMKQSSDHAQAIKTAQDKVNDAKIAANSAKEAVTSAQQAQTTAQEQADNADAAVKADQDILTNASQQVQAANRNVQQAQNDVNNAANQGQAIQAAQADVNAKTTAKNQADQRVKEAQSALETAKQSVNRLQSELDSPSDVSEDLPTFTFTDQQKRLTQALVQEVKNYWAQQVAKGTYEISTNDIFKMPSFTSWEQAMTTTDGNQSLSFLGVNWHDQNASDQSTIVNPNNLSTAQVQELSEWTAALLNSLTQQLGIQNDVGKFTVTTGSVDLAKEVAELTSENNQSGRGHYLYGLNKAAYDHGLTDSQTYVTD